MDRLQRGKNSQTDSRSNAQGGHSFKHRFKLQIWCFINYVLISCVSGLESAGNLKRASQCAVKLLKKSPNKIVFEEECPQFTISSDTASPTHPHQRLCLSALFLTAQLFQLRSPFTCWSYLHLAFVPVLFLSHLFVEGEPILKAGLYPHPMPSPFDLDT